MMTDFKQLILYNLIFIEFVETRDNIPCFFNLLSMFYKGKQAHDIMFVCPNL